MDFDENPALTARQIFFLDFSMDFGSDFHEIPWTLRKIRPWRPASFFKTFPQFFSRLLTVLVGREPPRYGRRGREE